MRRDPPPGALRALHAAGGAGVPAEARAVRALYLHIPFCERRCEYCDFVSMAGREREAEYLDALRAEVRDLAARVGRLRLDSVFVGGGTPSYADPHRLAGLLAEVQRGFDLGAGCEVTLEANPSSVSVGRARSWFDAGFNRVSIGIQGLEGDVLGFLGRVHDRERALSAVGEVRAAGFRRVSCDLIYAVPGLDDARWAATLERVLALGPEHVSAYELTVEPGTPLHARVRRGQSPPVDAGAALRQHRLAVAILGQAGLPQYEVSNYARRGEECRHNLVYWRHGHYLAAGLGAHGHLPAALAPALGLSVPPGATSVRYWHGRSLPAYLAASARGPALEGWEWVGPAEAEEERILLGLRLAEGIPARGAAARAAPLVAAGLLWRRGGRIGATALGQEVLDEVIRRLIG